MPACDCCGAHQPAHMLKTPASVPFGPVYCEDCRGVLAACRHCELPWPKPDLQHGTCPRCDLVRIFGSDPIPQS